MSVSQNGWTINPPLAVLTVHGVTFGGAHTGDAHVVLEYVATRYDAEVERLIAGTCGCYNPRLIPGSNVWSNHASATAIDCNWQRHPLGARGTYTAAQVRTIRSILAFCDGVIRWGGDFSNVDEMHFEINRDAAAVKALAAKIRNQEDDMSVADAKQGVADAFAAAAAPADGDAGRWGRQFRDTFGKVVDGAMASGPLLDAFATLAAQVVRQSPATAQEIAAALAPLINAQLGDGATPAEVEAAVRNVLRTGVE
jgi:hypothetical protein